jgi:hypothetical protein
LIVAAFVLPNSFAIKKKNPATLAAAKNATIPMSHPKENVFPQGAAFFRRLRAHLNFRNPSDVGRRRLLTSGLQWSPAPFAFHRQSLSPPQFRFQAPRQIRLHQRV